MKNLGFHEINTTVILRKTVDGVKTGTLGKVISVLPIDEKLNRYLVEFNLISGNKTLKLKHTDISRF